MAKPGRKPGWTKVKPVELNLPEIVLLGKIIKEAERLGKSSIIFPSSENPSRKASESGVYKTLQSLHKKGKISLNVGNFSGVTGTKVVLNGGI